MANTKSAEKRTRRNERRRVINHSRVTRMRSFVKKVEAAIEAKDVEAAKTAFLAAQPEIHRAASKGVIKKNTAARKISRLAGKVNKLTGAA
jgi:small subunit ribosomal protein S20